MTNKESVGAASFRLSKKPIDNISAHEQMQENLTDYEKNIRECVEKHKNIFPDDFYIVVITKQEKLMRNVFRAFFFARISCPTPDYDQTVYRYIKKDDKLEFVWVIPDRQASIYMINNKKDVTPDKYDILKFVLDFKDGTLYKLAKKLNNEKKDSIFTE